jgi:hypothetical protein
MKLLIEILLSIILHPIGGGKKVLWAILGLIWGIGPILYILIGDGVLW